MSGDPFRRYRLVFPDPPAEPLSEDFPLGLRVSQAFLWRAARVLGGALSGPAVVAVYQLWWRAFVLVHDAVRIQGRGAVTATRFLERGMSELMLHLALISEPALQRPDTGHQFADAFVDVDTDARVRDRLGGYLAWILHGEIWSIRKTLSPDKLEMIFEAATARDLERELSEDPKGFPALAALVEGPDETLTDAEAAEERKVFVAAAERELQRLRALYHAPALMEWRSMLDGAKRPVGLRDLLDRKPERKSSITSAWGPAGLDIGALGYAEVSGMIHGNVLWPVHVFERDVIGVGRLDDPDHVERRFGSAARVAALHVFWLSEYAAGESRTCGAAPVQWTGEH